MIALFLKPISVVFSACHRPFQSRHCCNTSNCVYCLSGMRQTGAMLCAMYLTVCVCVTVGPAWSPHRQPLCCRVHPCCLTESACWSGALRSFCCYQLRTSPSPGAVMHMHMRMLSSRHCFTPCLLDRECADCCGLWCCQADVKSAGGLASHVPPVHILYSGSLPCSTLSLQYHNA